MCHTRMPVTQTYAHLSQHLRFGASDHAVWDASGTVAPFCDATGKWLPLLCTQNCTGLPQEVRHNVHPKGCDVHMYRPLNVTRCNLTVQVHWLLVLQPTCCSPAGWPSLFHEPCRPDAACGKGACGMWRCQLSAVHDGRTHAQLASRSRHNSRPQPWVRSSVQRVIDCVPAGMPCQSPA